jgi:hypothetical protein
MSLDQIVKIIVDESGTVSPYMRAIRLFEFQVAIFNPNSFRKLVSAERNDRAPSQLLRTACIFAAIKFLEDIEAELRKSNADKAVSIKQLAENPDFQVIFDKVVAPNGGWPRIRHSESVKRFDKKKVAVQCDLAETVAKFIDFSYRFDKNPIETKYRGGITTAVYVVRTANSYQSEMSRSKAAKRWRRFRTTAVFLYLLLVQKFPLMPPKVSSKHFSRDLMKQIEDIATLRDFFRAYQDVCETLIRRGYKFEKLDYNLNCDVPRFEISAFPPDVATAFQESKKAIAGE